jgi:hypothetical protein
MPSYARLGTVGFEGEQLRTRWYRDRVTTGVSHNLANNAGEFIVTSTSLTTRRGELPFTARWVRTSSSLGLRVTSGTPIGVVSIPAALGGGGQGYSLVRPVGELQLTFGATPLVVGSTRPSVLNMTARVYINGTTWDMSDQLTLQARFRGASNAILSTVQLYSVQGNIIMQQRMHGKWNMLNFQTAVPGSALGVEIIVTFRSSELDESMLLDWVRVLGYFADSPDYVCECGVGFTGRTCQTRIV